MTAGVLEHDSVLSGSGLVPWHRTNSIVIPGQATFAEALEAAKLTWTVSKRDIVTVDGLAIPFRKAVVRDDTSEVLAVVSDAFRPIQNVEAAAFLQRIIDTNEAVVETAGSLFNGRQVWFMVRIGEDILIGGKDHIVPFVLIANGHDGSLALHLRANAHRVICNNTLQSSLWGESSGAWSMTHTALLDGRVQEARAAIGLTFKFYEAFAIELEQLAQTTLSETLFEEKVAYGLFPEPEDPNALTERQRESLAARRLTLLSTYRESPTVDRGTAYGAYQAVSQFLTHVKDVNREKTDRYFDRKLARMWFGDEREQSRRGIELVKAAAGLE